MSYDPGTLMHWIDVTIKDEHQEAFKNQHDCPREFKYGDVVWLYDHYNTGTIISHQEYDDGWMVRTTDADGSVHEYAYQSSWLAHAKTERRFDRAGQ